MSTFSLLIWEVVPEETHFYLIPDEEVEVHRVFLRQAHNCFINVSGWEDNVGLHFLNSALAADDIEKEGIDDEYKVFFGILSKFRVDSTQPIIENISHVYFSGFLL